jgi:hypothetical protein
MIFYTYSSFQILSDVSPLFSLPDFASDVSGIALPNIVHIGMIVTASVVWWSEFMATDPEARVRFPALPEKKK